MCILSGCCVVLLCSALFAQPLRAAETAAKARVCIKGACVNADISDTDESRARGLMFRESLSDDEGMIFIFPQPGRYSFWMMNMRIPIDIIWIDAKSRIVDITASAAPCANTCETITPRSDARSVLEVKAGFAGKHAIVIGDPVETVLSQP
jgi:uncharacterized protein